MISKLVGQGTALCLLLVLVVGWGPLKARRSVDSLRTILQAQSQLEQDQQVNDWLQLAVSTQDSSLAVSLLALAQGQQDPILIGRSHQALGNIYRLLEKAKTAQFHFDAAFNSFSRLGQQDLMRKSLDQLQKLQRTQRQYDGALETFKKIQAICAAQGDSICMAEALNQQGRMQAEMEQRGQAQSLYYQALSIYEGLNHKPGMAGTLSLLGAVALDESRFDEALLYFRRALRTQ
ncbi:MAG: tetratricopeptide repeat protein, partial [Bacteroidota bacterium]